MDNTLFGIPLYIWGFICLGIGAVYFYIWPKPNPSRTQPRGQRQQFVLRYFHALVWLLLALACFMAEFGMGLVAWLVAMAGFGVYIYFMIVFMRDRNAENSDLLAQRRGQKTAAQSAAKSEQAEIPDS